jgi:superfamily II DNA or RNA helicase
MLMTNNTIPSPSQISPILKKNLISTAQAIDHYLQNESTILYSKQVKITKSIVEQLYLLNSEIFIDVPTGVGKTVIFTQVAYAILKKKPRSKILVVTDSIHLVEQIKESFQKFAPTIRVGLFYSYSKQIDFPVIITTYVSLPYFTKNHAYEYDFIVFDEAHMSLSNTRIRYRKKFHNAILFAATATPSYSEKKTLQDHFTLAYQMSVNEAVKAKLICGFRNIKVNSYCANLNKVKTSISGNYVQKSLDEAINIHSRNFSAAEFYQSAIDPYTGIPLLGKRGIVNCVGIGHAYNVEKEFLDLISPHQIGGKTPCVAIHGRSKDFYMPNQLRKEILRAAQHGEILLLASSDLLIHGYDDPKIELCLNLAPSRSIVDVQQRGGRATRYDKQNPLKTALIVDFIDEGTETKKKALLYGDVIGTGSCILQKEDKRVKKNSLTRNKTFSHYEPTHNPISGEFLKDLQIHWYPEEVNAIIQQNRIAREQTEWKKEDELSVSDISREMRIEYTSVNKIINRLQKGKQLGFYYDSLCKNKKSPTFQIVLRNVCGKDIRCLKRPDLKKFCKTYNFYEIKGPNDLSVKNIAKESHASEQLVRKIFKELKPLNKTDNFYYHPKDKTISFQIVTRRGPGDYAIMCLKKEDLEKFKQLFSPHPYKKEDELSIPEISKRLKMKNENVRKIINRMQPVKNKTELYFDPENNSDKRIFYKIVMRRSSNFYTRCLKEVEFEKFREIYAPFLSKQKGELSPDDISQRLQLDVTTCKELLNRYQLLLDSRNDYFYPQEKNGKPTTIQIEIRRGRRGANTRCIKEQDLKIFAKQHGLKFRTLFKQKHDLLT